MTIKIKNRDNIISFSNEICIIGSVLLFAGHYINKWDIKYALINGFSKYNAMKNVILQEQFSSTSFYGILARLGMK